MAEGAIRPGESVTATLSLKAGQYLRAAVEQQGIEVELILSKPDGKRVAAGGPVSRQGVKVLSSVILAPGVYHLSVAPAAAASAPGRYGLFVEEQRPLRAEDYNRVAAQRRLAEGLRDRDERGDFPRALAQLEEALPLWRAAGDVAGEVDTTNEIGLTEVWLLRPNAAVPHLERALATARQAGYVRGQADAWNNLGNALSLVQPEKALGAYRQAIALWKALGDPTEQGNSLYNLGFLFFRRVYDLDQARQAFEESLPLRHGNPAGLAYTLVGLGLVAEGQGDLDKALEYYERARASRAGAHVLEATILSNMAAIHLRRGKLQEALNLYDLALANGGPGERGEEAEILHNLASLYSALGAPEKALARYHDVLALQKGNPALAAITLNSIGTVLFALSDT
ncbi:MAG TPA: tetratricopeptide repeat protein, partial [Thermoanaerobaculia bacterium]|nr:tetratricopeptide repeat protein [Thermoanaerobaculia bacterium]